LVLIIAVETNGWVCDSLGLSVGEGHSLIEVWAFLKRVDGRSPVWILLLSKLVLIVAVVSNGWVCDSFGLSVGEGHSLIEVWAFL
jgi:hypothetical protein